VIFVKEPVGDMKEAGANNINGGCWEGSRKLPRWVQIKTMPVVLYISL